MDYEAIWILQQVMKLNRHSYSRYWISNAKFVPLPYLQTPETCSVIKLKVQFKFYGYNELEITHKLKMNEHWGKSHICTELTFRGVSYILLNLYIQGLHQLWNWIWISALSFVSCVILAMILSPLSLGFLNRPNGATTSHRDTCACSLGWSPNGTQHKAQGRQLNVHLLTPSQLFKF